jgi:hypothetical protein
MLLGNSFMEGIKITFFNPSGKEIEGNVESETGCRECRNIKIR